jgi:tetratricopeptide (TPR) repeat protein
MCSNAVTTKKNRCERCGEDLTAYKKMYLISNRYYNEGLEKANVRDLSGAVLVLKKSLEMNKKNTNARNLLGLVFYEMGETVAALSEWVISKHFQPNENDADEYMEALQSNPTKLETMNQTIKKYNLALQSVKQGNEDLAIIQLKKVTSLNPHFVKAFQLLALLHMKNGEIDKASKCLMKANKIDVSNTTTLKYLQEIREMSGEREDTKSAGRESARKAPETNSVFPMSTYKEDKPNVWAFINLLLGVVIGVCVVFFLIVPTVKNGYINQKTELENEFNAEINKHTQTIASLEKEKSELKDQIEQLQGEIDGIEIVEYDETIYDELFEAARIYSTELSKNNPNDLDYSMIAEALSKVNQDKLKRESAINLYNLIKDATFVVAAENLYEEGHDFYSAKKYDEALETLLQAYEYDSNNVNVTYFIGRSYHQLKDYDNAKIYYTILTEDFPDTSRAREAADRLAGLD